MTTASTTATLDIDPDGAYAFLTDLEFLPAWYPGIRDVAVRGGGAPRAGAVLVERRSTPVPLLALPVPMRVVDARPGVRYAVRAAVPLTCTVDAAYEISPDGDGSRVSVTYHVTPDGLATTPASRILAWVLQRQARAQVQAMPAGLAAWRGDSLPAR